MKKLLAGSTIAALMMGLGGVVAFAGVSDGDTVKGKFTLRDENDTPPGVDGNFTIDARSDSDGDNARGTYTVRGVFNGTTSFDARVRCLEVDRKVAIVGTTVTEVRRDRLNQVEEGDTVVFRFEDRGEPGAGRDVFFGQNVGDVPPRDACEIDPEEGDTIDEGNFDVRDRRPIGGQPPVRDQGRSADESESGDEDESTDEDADGDGEGNGDDDEGDSDDDKGETTKNGKPRRERRSAATEEETASEQGGQDHRPLEAGGR